MRPWHPAPKPVTSVAKHDLSYFIRSISAAVLFRYRSWSGWRLPLFRRGGRPHGWHVQKSPTPSALVRMSWSPGRPEARCGQGGAGPQRVTGFVFDAGVRGGPAQRGCPATATTVSHRRSGSPRTFRSMLSGKSGQKTASACRPSHPASLRALAAAICPNGIGAAHGRCIHRLHQRKVIRDAGCRVILAVIALRRFNLRAQRGSFSRAAAQHPRPEFGDSPAFQPEHGTLIRQFIRLVLLFGHQRSVIPGTLCT